MEYTKLKNINFYKSENINPSKYPNDVFEMYSVQIYETGHPEYLRGEEIASSKSLVKKNDILLCKINPRINRVWIVKDESDKINIASSEWIVIRNDEYNPEFLAWYLRSPKFQKLMTSEVTGIGGSLTRAQPKRVAEYPVPVLPFREQNEIAIVLNKAKGIIDNRKQELFMLDELIKARFVELTESVNTVATRMGDIATYINGYAFKPTDWTESGLPIIRIQNLNDVNAKYNYFDGKIDSKYLVTTGDVLVSWATHLEAYIWDGDSAWLNQHIFKALFDKMPINKLYFVYATEDALRQAFKNAHGFKPTMEHIKRRDFENAIVKLPDMEIQNQFADFVARTNKSKLLEAWQAGFIAKIR